MKILFYIPLQGADNVLISRLEKWTRQETGRPEIFLLGIGDDEIALRKIAGLFRDHPRAVFLLGEPGLTHGAGLKLGARYAVDQGFDCFVPVHPRWDTHPAKVVERVDAFLRNGADYLRLDRVPSFGAAKTEILRHIPFELAEDGAAFDVELRFQVEYSGGRVQELLSGEGETPSGYRWSVLKSEMGFRLHRSGVFCSLKYSRGSTLKYFDKSSLPGSSHAEALSVIRKLRPTKLLDVGSGPGHFAARCAALGIEVTAVDREAPLPADGVRFQSHDLESDGFPVEPAEFDVVAALDVIEHLSRPERLLLSLRNGRTVLVSTPNVAFLPIRLSLLLGRFNYAERGILDVDHKRLFTRGSLRGLLENCGYEIQRCIPIGAPATLALPGSLGVIATKISGWLARIWPSVFAFQFLFVCRSRAAVRQLPVISAPKDRMGKTA